MRSLKPGSYAQLCIVLSLLANFGIASARVPMRKSVAFGGQYIAVDIIDDNVVHFEMGHGQPPALSAPLPTSVMLAPETSGGRNGASRGHLGHPVSSTPALDVEIETTAECLIVRQRQRDGEPIRLCLQKPGHMGSQITLDRADTSHIYGLGEQFNEPGMTDGDFMGKWRGGGVLGNDMVAYSGGMVGNAQFPIMYCLGPNKRTFGLFLDEPKRVTWDFTKEPLLITAPTGAVRGYLLFGDDLPQVRRRFMALVGRPPVPPKPAFGLWLSKYGYRSWDEVRQEVTAMRTAKIPIDGVVLDLFWFGGVDGGGPNTRMGTLHWDPNHFGDPVKTLASLKHDLGVEVMVIEESYVGDHLPEWEALKQRKMLATTCGTSEPAAVLHDSINHNRDMPQKDWFWGAGGMIDWTQPEARSFWHHSKRAPLVDAGVLGFWTDLSEPRMFNYDACYTGGGGTMPAPAKQSDVHNLYALLWHQGIQEGLAEQGAKAGPLKQGVRPFLLSRSGTAGIQRYGAAMWSGDIGSNMQSLAAHMNAQMHLSLSGIDYFGADIGGFWRSGLDGDDEGALFSSWLANGALLDVPVRPHTMDNKRHQSTNPALLGDVAGNRQAIIERYALTPYLYTLAHQAALIGEAVFPPLVYHFQDDANTRTLGHEKMLGQDILVSTITRYDEATQDIYLPKGRWTDFRSNQVRDSAGAWHRGISNTWQGHVVLPTFVRAGAILPLMAVTDATRNTLSPQESLLLRVYPGDAATERELIEDDGLSPAYASGAVRTTVLSQSPIAATPDKPNSGLRVVIGGAQGEFKGAVKSRAKMIEVIETRAVAKVSVDGHSIEALHDNSQRHIAQEGYWISGSGALCVKTANQDVTRATIVEVLYAD